MDMQVSFLSYEVQTLKERHPDLGPEEVKGLLALF